jgi:hypothetical protein
MTALTPDILIHRGKELALFGRPFYEKFRNLPRDQKPELRFRSTTCPEGYVANWEIINRRLYLTGISVMKDFDSWETIHISSIFNQKVNRVFADWVWETLRCPEGKLTRYRHAGFASEYERDRYLDIQNGVLIRETLCLNPPPPIWYEINSDGSRICIGDEGDETPINDPCAGDEEPTQARAWILRSTR